MSYLTLREASEATGLNAATIRRLCKKPVSQPFIQMKKGKKGAQYTVQADYLFDIYPPSRFDKNPSFDRVPSDYISLDKKDIQDVARLLAVKDELIKFLKSEANYLRTENTHLWAENRELKSQANDPAPTQPNQVAGTPKKQAILKRITTFLTSIVSK